MDTSDRSAVRQEVEELFPELEEISDATLREKVVDVWVTAIQDNDMDTLRELPWGAYHDDIHGERQVEHIRQVTQHAISMCDQIAAQRAGAAFDRDVVVASALLHDVSKLYEMTPDGGFSELWAWIPHPIMANYLCTKHGLSPHIQRIILSHTHQTNVEPKTLEGQIVKLADLITLEALSAEHRGRPHNLIEATHYPADD